MHRKHIYFVRHGECSSNIGNIFQGADDPLTPKGIEQSEFIGKRCVGLCAEVILSSHMVRAFHTAEIIAKHTGLPLVKSDILHEVLTPSEIKGLTYKDPRAKEILDKRKEYWQDPNWRHSDEENFHDITTRAAKALALFESRPESKIIVATHGHFMRAMLATMIFGVGKFDDPVMMRGINSTFKTDNTGLTYCYVENGKWTLITWNDQAHLADGLLK